jgi:hypothetical protein
MASSNVGCKQKNSRAGMKTKVPKLVAIALVWALSAGAQVTPFNSWRALIIYTNSTDAIYGGTGVNMYKDYFLALFDGINQVYEDSQIESRAQIAGVIWDKTYAQDSEFGIAGYEYKQDLKLKTNGMGRYVDLLEKYAADAIILVHDPTPAGYAFILNEAIEVGYGGFWSGHPNDIRLFAHEMGHMFVAPNHLTGHRVTLDATGKQLGGALPDTVPVIFEWAQVGSQDYWYTVGHFVEAETGDGQRGFHTTMAYPDGSPLSCANYKHHNYEDSSRWFEFRCHGAPHFGTGWAGVFSNPALTWIDLASNTAYSVGADTASYLRTLKYHALDTISFRDTVKYVRNSALLHNATNDTIVNLKGVPSILTVTPDMSLGSNSADSQWVYAHFVATTLVDIQPGFSITGRASLKISVGTTSGVLAKPRIGGTNDMLAKKETKGLESDFRIKYDPAKRVVGFSFGNELVTEASIYMYSVNGKLMNEPLTLKVSAPRVYTTFSVANLPAGVYLVRVVAGRKFFHGKIFKP